MDQIDRLFALVGERFKEQKDFADAIGVSPSKVSEWKKRKAKSYTKYLPQIAAVLGTTTEYILTGKENSPTTEAVGLSQEFVRIFDELSPQNKTEIIAEMLRRKRQQQQQ